MLTYLLQEGGLTVDHSSKGLFDKIEQRTNMTMDDIYRITQSVQHIDFTDERAVRNLVRRLASLTNRTISREKEDKIVRSITNNQVPTDLQSLNRYFD